VSKAGDDRIDQETKVNSSQRSNDEKQSNGGAQVGIRVTPGMQFFVCLCVSSFELDYYFIASFRPSLFLDPFS
jgi:hypothetical protein